MTTITRAMLTAAVVAETDLNKRDVSNITQRLIEIVSERLEAGELVKLTNFGSFAVRSRAERPGRNPQSLVEHKIAARRVVVFLPSGALLQKVDTGRKG